MHGQTGPLTDLEGDMVTSVKTSMENVADALAVPKDEAFSLNSLTRLVYDPFPARLTVVVKGGGARERRFVESGGVFERPPVDAWSALESLVDRWVAPDLVTAAFAPVAGGRAARSRPRTADATPSPLWIATRRLRGRRGSVGRAGARGNAANPVALRCPRQAPEFGDAEPNWSAVMTGAEASVPD